MTSNSSQSTRPVGRVLWEELLEEVRLHITPLCSLLQTLLKDKWSSMCYRTSENCKSFVQQDMCNIEIFFDPCSAMASLIRYVTCYSLMFIVAYAFKGQVHVLQDE